MRVQKQGSHNNFLSGLNQRAVAVRSRQGGVPLPQDPTAGHNTLRVKVVPVFGESPKTFPSSSTYKKARESDH